jgi:L-lysine 2,3-aminomutase
VQHKYRQTVLYFPSQGQTCHAFCTFCFRWAQFVGRPELKMASRRPDRLVRYLKLHPQVSDVLITGGDPMVMSARALARVIEPLLDPALEHVTSIRIGTKSLSYWPLRFLSETDADDVLRLFERVRASGRHLALMAHFEHPRELEAPLAQAALRRILDAGAAVRVQAPVLRHVNDFPHAWAELWRLAVRLGATPYYMFVARDTGPRDYFRVPLVEAWDIYRRGVGMVSGLARTVRGPSMSALPGKIRVNGVSEAFGKKVMVLEYLQARREELAGRPFFARYDPRAAWLDELEPAFAGDLPFFQRQGQAGLRLMSA